MRKIGQEFRQHLAIHARQSNRRRLQWRRWKRKKNSGLLQKKETALIEGESKQVWAKRDILAPKTFCLDENYEQSAKFIDRVRHKLREEIVRRSKFENAKRPKRMLEYADYSSIKYISPTTALVLASEFDNFRHVTGQKLYTINEHLWSNYVVFVFRSLGFHELLEMKPLVDFSPQFEKLKILKFCSGQNADGPMSGHLQDALLQMLPEDAAQALLYAEPYSGLLEAMLNSWSWAYPDDYQWEVATAERWWVTGFADLKTNRVTIVAFDRGVTIPYSLPNSKYAERTHKIMNKVLAKLGGKPGLDDVQYDGLAIQTAMKVARTATGLSQHGKGLGSILDVAQRAAYGRLRILSRHGEFTWETGKGSAAKFNETPIYGTLIEWQLELGGTDHV